MKTIKPFDGIVGGMIERESLTTSLHIADVFGKRHDNVLQTINNMKQGVRGRLNIQESYYINTQNKKQKVYRLNRDACTFLIMGFTGEKAEEFKLRYIDAFNAMEEFIKSRLQGSFWHKLMMEALEETRDDEGKLTKSHHYSNEARLINKGATGCFDRHGRDSFNQDETEIVEKLQKLNHKLILKGLSYQERKVIVLSILGDDG